MEAKNSNGVKWGKLAWWGYFMMRYRRDFGVVSDEWNTI
jgi:hypothetical protein